MTVAANDRLAGPYNGNGVTVAFAYDWFITANTELRVILRSAAGVDVTQTLTSAYTVSGVGVEAGGNVTFVTAPPTGSKVIIEAVTPLTQPVNYVENDRFPYDSHQSAFDKTKREIQENRRDVDRALKYPHGETVYRLPLKPSETKLLAQTSDGEITHVAVSDVSVDAVALGAGWSDVLGLASASVLDNLAGVRFVSTYASLTALVTATGLADNAVYCTYGRAAEEDGGFGFWRYDSGSSATANGGTILAIDGGGAGRFFRLHDDRNFNVEWWGAVGNGSTDDSTAINNAIIAVGALGGGYINFKAAKYAIASTVNLGDGSTSQISSINSVILRGQGWETALNAQFNNNRRMTTFVWTGSADGRCVDIKGPCRGNAIQNIMVDGSGTAGYGVRLYSAAFGEFRNWGVWRCRTKAIEFDIVEIPDATLDATGGGIDYSIRGPSDNTFIGTEIDGYTGVTSYACVAIFMDGWDASNLDPVRNSFINTKIIVNLNHNVSAGRAGVGVWLRFVDSNNWHDTWYQGLGTPSSPTTASWLYLEGVAVGSAQYPVNNSFSGKLQRGQSLKVTRDATSASPGGNMFVPIGEVDNEYVPKWPETKVINGYHPESVDSDAEINYVSEYGLQRIRDERRNQLLNSGFWRATRATTFSSPAASSYTLDGWVIDYDGTPVGLEVSQQAFTLGQTDVAWEPRYHARVVVASASGMTAFSFSQRIEDVRRFSGRNCCLSVWAKVSTGTITLSGRVDQDFGTGGSPSANVVTNCNTEDASQTVTTTWQRFRFRFAMPSVSGKTLGSGGNDHTDVIFSLPLNSGFTLDLAEPQFEYGLTDSPWDRHSKDLTAEEALCARYLRSIPRTLNRIYNDFAVVSTANLLDSIVKFPAMRAAPALVVSGAASDYQIRDYAGNNGGNCDSSPTLVQVGTEAAILRFTLTAHGLSAGTLGRQESGSSGLLLLSSEL